MDVDPVWSHRAIVYRVHKPRVLCDASCVNQSFLID